MKKINKLTYFVIAAFLLAVMNISCAKIGDFGDTNVNPNNSSSAATSSYIAAVQSRLGGLSVTTLGGYFAQYFAQPTYPVESRYSNPQVNGTGTYSGILQDCQLVINKNTDPLTSGVAAQSGSNANQIAIARIMKAYIFWDVTDKYGNVPYSEALKGAANLTPKYDAQKDIYEDLIKELTQANAQFDANGVYVQGDIIYGYLTPMSLPTQANQVSSAVQVSRWKKFANSLRMLMSLRLSKKYPNAGEYAATQFSLAVNDGAGHFTSNADNFALGYQGGSIALNNPWNNQGNSADIGESETMTKALTNSGDGRIAAFGSNATGVPYGCQAPANTAINYAKILSGTFKAPTGPVVFIGASSVWLAKAEAYERGWVAGKTTVDAEAAYNAGVTESFSQWGLTPGTYLTGAANYLAGAGAGNVGGACTVAGASATTNTKLQRIWLQQWFAFYPSATQGWSNWRRTGFPAITPSSQASNAGGQIPRRYTFGASDYSLNLAQVTAAAAAMGGDTQDVKVWWDQ
jgi:hypothetical protein